MHRTTLAAAIRSIVASLSLCVCVAATAEPTPPAAPTTAPAVSFAHLPHRDGGPDWTFEALFAALPPGPGLAADPKKPIPPVKDAIAALRTAFNELRSSDSARLQFAFRLVGATSNQTKDIAATKLLALLQHHGVGTHSEPGAAIRTALDLVRAGDREAALFVARDSPKSFASIAKPITSLKRLGELSQPTVVKLSAPIVSMDGQKLTVGGNGDKPLDFELETIVDKLKVGRVVTVAGVWSNGHLDALVGEVPEPAYEFKWDLVRRAIRRGEWRLQTVQVVVTNKGIQPIKSATLTVHCRHANGWDRTRTAHVGAIAPGANARVTVNFESYGYDYSDAVSAPQAEVSFEELEW